MFISRSNLNRAPLAAPNIINKSYFAPYARGGNRGVSTQHLAYSLRTTISEWTSHLFLIYVLTSCGYLVITRHYGTPLKDSFDEKQMQIKHESAKRRKLAFRHSLLWSVLIVLLWRPFSQINRASHSVHDGCKI